MQFFRINTMRQAIRVASLPEARRYMSSVVPDRQSTIGLIGLGQMGQGMAKNLVQKATGAIVIHDVNQAAIEQLTSTYPQLIPASSPAEVAEKAATVVTMVPEASHVEKVFKSMIEAVDSSSMIVDSSTIDPQSARRLSSFIMDNKSGALAFDAPVSGGVMGADAGTLTFMVGSPTEEGFEKIKPKLSWMGKNIVYCGKNGSGQIAKLCNNMLLGISMIGLSEAFDMARRLGLDPKLLSSIVNTSTGRCWSSEVNNPLPGLSPTAPVNRGYKGGFTNKLIAKDLRLAMIAAKDASAHPALGALAAEIYNHLSSTDEYTGLDFSSVYKWLEESS